MKLLKNGQKVEYRYMGKWLKGIVHGVKTHETPEGIITRVAYLIDTGKTIREDIGHEPTGKMLLNTLTKKKDIPEMKEVTVRQPEQIEVGQDLVRAV